jgi:putative membrane protein
MILEIFLFVILGCLIGTLTGLTPGIHINLVAAVLLSSPAILAASNEANLAAFIISLAITHTFLDFLPSIFLGCPNEDTALSILPGHKYLLKGEGYEAARLTLLGSLSAIGIFLVLSPIIIVFLPKIYPLINRLVAPLMIWATLILFISNKENRWGSLMIFILSGMLGIINVNTQINQPLLPLLSGLFGAPTLILAITSRSGVPEQKITKKRIDKKECIKPILVTSLISPICSILPGIGSSHAAIIGSKITREIKESQFLILLGSVGTLVMATSFVTLIAIGKSRSGAAEALTQLGTHLPSITLIITCTILSATIASLIFIKISKIFAKNINKINYSKISLTILIFNLLVIILVCGILGVLFFSVATLIGLLCSKLNVQKHFLMGSLIVPTILFFTLF